MHNNPEFSRAGATTQVEDGNFRLSTRFLEHCPVALPPANQKRGTRSAALVPNAASLSWGRLGTYQAPCLAPVCSPLTGSNSLGLHCGYCKGLPHGVSGKEPGCQCRRHSRRGFNPWVGKIPWRRKWLPTPIFLPRESHEQRNLVGYSPKGRKELDTTEVTVHISYLKYCKSDWKKTLLHFCVAYLTMRLGIF